MLQLLRGASKRRRQIASCSRRVEEVVAAGVKRHLDVMPRLQAPDDDLDGYDVILEHARHAREVSFDRLAERRCDGDVSSC